MIQGLKITFWRLVNVLQKPANVCNDRPLWTWASKWRRRYVEIDHTAVATTPIPAVIETLRDTACPLIVNRSAARNSGAKMMFRGRD